VNIGSSDVSELFFGDTSSHASNEPGIGAADDGLDGSINGSGLAVDDAGFGAGACTTSVDPWSGPGGAELDDTYASDESTGFPHVLKYSSAGFSNSSNLACPKQLSRLRVCAPHRRMLDVSLAPIQVPRERNR
jgi:hypothetical protein